MEKRNVLKAKKVFENLKILQFLLGVLIKMGLYAFYDSTDGQTILHAD